MIHYNKFDGSGSSPGHATGISEKGYAFGCKSGYCFEYNNESFNGQLVYISSSYKHLETEEDFIKCIVDVEDFIKFQRAKPITLNEILK